MNCFVARVMQSVALENPTLVVITDRNDQDGQLFGVFSLSQHLLREQPVQTVCRGTQWRGVSQWFKNGRETMGNLKIFDLWGA